MPGNRCGGCCRCWSSPGIWAGAALNSKVAPGPRVAGAPNVGAASCSAWSLSRDSPTTPYCAQFIGGHRTTVWGLGSFRQAAAGASPPDALPFDLGFLRFLEGWFVVSVFGSSLIEESSPSSSEDEDDEESPSSRGSATPGRARPESNGSPSTLTLPSARSATKALGFARAAALARLSACMSAVARARWS